MRVAWRGTSRFMAHRFTAGDLQLFWGFVGVGLFGVFVCFSRLRDCSSLSSITQ